MASTEADFENLKKESQSGLAMRKMRLGFLQDFDWGAIQKLRDTVRNYLRVPAEDRMKQYGDDLPQEQLQTLYEEESVYGDQLAALADELAVVALYKKLEIDTKKAIKIVFPNKSIDQLNSLEDIVRFLKGKGIDIESFRTFSEVDELRHINNRVKHGAIVNEALAKFGHWKKGERLRDLDRHFFRLAEAAEQHMAALAKELMHHLI